MPRRGAPAPATGAKVITAADYVKRRRRTAVRVALLGFGLLLGGLFLNGPRTQVLALMSLIGGTMASWVGIALMDRWVAMPRAEDALAGALAESGPLFTLYNWALPADHVVVAPWGLAVLHPFNTEGPVAIDGPAWRDRRPLWRRLLAFGRRAIRNPRPFVDADVNALRAALAEADPTFAAVPIAAVVVFTRPGLDLAAGPRPPDPDAVVAAGLRAWLRDEGRRHPALPPADGRRLQAVVAGLAAPRVGAA